MSLTQMQTEQISGPNGLVIAEVTRIGVDKLRNDWLNDTSDDRWTARALGVGEAGRQVEFGALLEAENPVVNRGARYAQPTSDVADSIARAEPIESLGTAQEHGIVSGLNQITKSGQVIVRNVNLSHHPDCAIGILYLVKELLN
jgi:hypothetical protein